MSDEKMQVLDDKFLDAEAVKNQVVQECNQLSETFQQLQNKLNAAQGTDLKEVLQKLQTFLDSGINTMGSIKNDLRSIAGDCVEIQKMFQQMGA